MKYSVGPWRFGGVFGYKRYIDIKKIQYHIKHIYSEQIYHSKYHISQNMPLDKYKKDDNL